MFFRNSLALLMIQRMLAIWSLVPLPFLTPAWTSGSSQWIVKCSLLHRRAQSRVSSSARTPADFYENLLYLKCTAQTHIPKFLKPSLGNVKGDTIRLQPWFLIRRVSWLYTVAYTNECHKDYKGDWLHRELSHSFWRQEILGWNLCVSVREASSAVGMLSAWLPGTWSKAHCKCEMEFPSLSRWSQLGLFLSSLTSFKGTWCCHVFS